MALTESTIKASRSINSLHRDMRPADSQGPTFFNLPKQESSSISALDGHFVARSLDLDLYNPMAASNKQKSQKGESKFPPSSIEDKEKNLTGIYPQYQHQKKSSTASLADFFKTTGPDDLRQQPVAEIARPVSPQGKKRNPGSFLLKFTIGKSAPSPKKDGVNEISTTVTVPDQPAPLAETQFTTAGRKYYAIKVDYPFSDDASISGRPLLSESPPDPIADTRSEMDYNAIMAMKKHHRISSVLASDTSMEFLVDGSDSTPRSSGLYTGNLPPRRNRHSLGRSTSLSEIMSPSESIRDDSSLLPGDSISLRPAQVNRARMSTAHGVIQSTSVPLFHAARHGLSIGGARSASSSYVTSAIPYSNMDSASAPSPIPPSSQAFNSGMDLIESLDILDQLRKRKAPDADSVVSYSTTRSLQQRRRARKLAQHSGSADETSHRGSVKPSRSTAALNSKGLPPIPPHMNNNTDDIRKARAAAVAAALSPRANQSTQDNNKHAPTRAFPTPPPHGSSLENYAIPEDDVLSLKSGASASRSLRREMVRAKRQKDFEDERSRKLDEAMRLLQKDVQRKRESLDREERKASSSVGSQTPRQLPTVERLGTPPRTPPPSFPMHQFSLSPVEVFVDCSPSGLRREPSKIQYLQSPQSPDEEPEVRPKTSNSQHTAFTNGPITPISSAPSSPTKAQYNHLAKQPIPQSISRPPSYPPPIPSPPKASHTKSNRLSRLPDDEDREMRIVALEEQKWVLEQALRVLLNQQSRSNTPNPSPIMQGYKERASPKPPTNPDRN